MADEVKNNPKENVWYAFRKKFNTEFQGMIDEDFEFYKKLNNDANIKEAMMKQMFNLLYESFKRAG